MDLLNETPFAARFLRYQPGEEADVQGTVVVKATYERGPNGAWAPSAEQVPIVGEPLETPFGIFHSDEYVRKEGVDLCVLGTVLAPRPVRSLQLTLTAGTHSTSLALFGDRRWIKSGRTLVPSGPEPFEQMPLAYSKAYGGSSVFDYETVTWPDNPVGRGYYLSAEAAEGQPLPNIESATGPQVKTWADQPQAAGWGPYPCYWGIRAREGVELPEKPGPGEPGRLKPRLNNQAHPSLVLRELLADAEIRIRGMRRNELVLQLPLFAPLLAFRQGETTEEATGALDGVFLWVDAGRVTLTRRIQFTYSYQRGRVRQARLVDLSTRGRGG